MKLLISLLMMAPQFLHSAQNESKLSPGPDVVIEQSAAKDESQAGEKESVRFRQVYREIEQSFKARGASPEIVNSLMQALKTPIQKSTRGPASESNVIDARGIDQIMLQYIESQEEDEE